MSELSIIRGRLYIPNSEKVRMVEELHLSGFSIAEVDWVNKMGLSSLACWREQYSAGGDVSIKADAKFILKKNIMSCRSKTVH